MAAMATLTKSTTLIKRLNRESIKSITTFSFLSQEAELAEPLPPPPAAPSPLPPNPASGSPLYNENWRNPIPNVTGLGSALVPSGVSYLPPTSRLFSQTLGLPELLNVFTDWTTSQRWEDMKQLFEFWIRSLDSNGKPNKPDVNLYNHYMRANVMMGASAEQLLDLVAQMEGYGIKPNTASFNLVLKAMQQAREVHAAEILLERMMQSEREAHPDDLSFDLVISMMLYTNNIDKAQKYIDLTLDSGHVLSSNAFIQCVQKFLNTGRLEKLVSVIERCKKTEQNKALCPPWILCNHIADVAVQEDNSELTYYALEFMARWIIQGENARTPIMLSVEEGLVKSALGTAGRTYSPKLLDGSWAILKRSLRQKKVPSPGSYLAKINAQASLGNLQKAFTTLREFETAYGDSSNEVDEELFSPFTSLNPLAVACSKNGFVTLDAVYYQLENLSKANPPYKSVAGLNCIVLGCASIWDVDRAYQTFEAISSEFGLTPNIHSYNALMYAFGKLNKTSEASGVFEHLTSIGVKPNATTFSLLVDAHLVARDPKAAVSIIDQMVSIGLEPSRELLKKVRRRCMRQMDYESDDRVDSLAKKFNIRLGTEARRDMLFNIQYGTNYAE